MDLSEEKLSRALSASSRRDILRLLAEQELTVKEIAQHSKQSVSLASRHLTFLRDLGLIEARKEAQHKFYSLKIKELNDLLVLYDKVIKKL